MWDAASKSYVNLQSTIVGLAPSTLSTLQALAEAVGNDPQFSSNLAVTTAAIQTSISAKAPLASPIFTGTVGGLSKAMVNLGNVDNTADAAKPVSTATQSSLDTKAPIANPIFTGTVGGLSKAMVQLSNVDNTADAAKPVSTANRRP